MTNTSGLIPWHYQPAERPIKPVSKLNEQGVNPVKTNAKKVASGAAELLGRAAEIPTNSDGISKGFVVFNAVHEGTRLAQGRTGESKPMQRLATAISLPDAVQVFGGLHYFVGGECAKDAKKRNGASVIMSHVAFFTADIATFILFAKDIAIGLLKAVFSPLVSSVFGYIVAGGALVGHLAKGVDAIQRLADKKLQQEAKENGVLGKYKFKAGIDLTAASFGTAAAIATIVITALAVSSGVGLPVLLSLGGVSALMGGASFGVGQYYDNKLAGAKKARRLAALEEESAAFLAAIKAQKSKLEKEEESTEKKKTSSFVMGIQGTTGALNALTENTDSLKYVANLGSGVVNVVSAVVGPDVEGMAPAADLGDVCRGFSGLASGTSIFARIREWLAIDASGKRFWQKKGEELKVVNRTFLTAANAADAAMFGHKMGVYDLGAPMSTKIGDLPALSAAKDAAVGVASIFSMAYNGKKLDESISAAKKGSAQLEAWKEVAEMIASDEGRLVAIQAFTSLAGSMDPSKRDQVFTKHLRAMPSDEASLEATVEELNSDDEEMSVEAPNLGLDIGSFVNAQIKLWSNALYASDVNKAKTGIAIAAEIAKIAIIILASVAAGMQLTAFLPFSASLLAVGLLVTSVQIVKIVYDAVTKRRLAARPVNPEELITLPGANKKRRKKEEENSLDEEPAPSVSRSQGKEKSHETSSHSSMSPLKDITA